MKTSFHTLAILLISIILMFQSAEADILTGTFDWTGTANNGEILFDPASGTATFTYDTSQNYGTLTNFYPGFSRFYVWTVVRFGDEIAKLPNPNDLPSNISTPMVTFADLTAFSSQTVQLPGLGGGPTSETLTNEWSFTGVNGQGIGGLGATSWAANDGNAFVTQLFNGTISNFQETLAVPEPSVYSELGLGLLLLLLTSRRLPRRTTY